MTKQKKVKGPIESQVSKEVMRAYGDCIRGIDKCIMFCAENDLSEEACLEYILVYLKCPGDQKNKKAR